MITNESIEAKACVAHIAAEDSDCEYCEAFVQWLKTKYDEQVTTNEQQEQYLAANGYPVNYLAFLDAKMDLMLQLIFKDKPSQRLRFEIAFTESVNEMQSEMVQQVNRAKLAANPRQAPPNIRG